MCLDRYQTLQICRPRIIKKAHAFVLGFHGEHILRVSFFVPVCLLSGIEPALRFVGIVFGIQRLKLACLG